MKNQKKLSQLSVVTDFLKKSDNFALFKFDKTKHIALEGLRRELRKGGATVKVVKNTILTKSINKLAAEKEHGDLRPFQKIAKNIKENTALVSLGKDWSMGMNAFAKVAKTDKSISFKFGFLDRTSYDGATMEKISNLPSKTELMAKIIGSMKSPITRFVNGIKFPTQKFVMVLNAKVKKG
ncbi:MAG: 50S ribosomal protein L10 [Candidatus Roizmanbacteria bacterium]|nr:50S ribosomal protein L10 [Candidatus Roizmanbacteria bacterium]